MKGKQIKREEEVDLDLHPWKGAEGEQRFPQYTESPCQWGDQLEKERSFSCLEEWRAQQLVCGRKNKRRLL